MSDPDALAHTQTAELLDLLRAWLPQQRWFAGKDHAITGLRVAGSWSLPTPGTRPDRPSPEQVVHLILGVELDGATWQTYQVPVSIRRPVADPGADPTDPSPAGAAGSGDDGIVVVGPMRDGSLVVDALTDPRVMGALLIDVSIPGILDPEVSHGTRAGGPHPPQVQRDAVRGAWAEASARRMSVEQSNTSYVLDERAMVKVFRQLAPGINPDIEVHEALGRVRCPHIGALLGWVNGGWVDADGTLQTGHLAMVQELLSPAEGAWELACARAEAGQPFAEEARSLGVATAEVHADLRRALGTRSLDAGAHAALVDRLRARLEANLTAVPALADSGTALRARIEALSGLDGLTVQRVHGDYHLGQVLRVGRAWKILDFEGEPGAPVAERVALDHPLRDVAGMLRSFAYAAAQGGAARTPEERLAWQTECEEAFLAGYASGGGSAGDLADAPEASEGGADQTILSAYLVDKAAYEAAYEQRFRPDWLPIPLAELTRLAT